MMVLENNKPEAPDRLKKYAEDKKAEQMTLL